MTDILHCLFFICLVQPVLHCETSELATLFHRQYSCMNMNGAHFKHHLFRLWQCLSLLCFFFLLQSNADVILSVTAENIDCFGNGIICRKSLLINIGRSFLAFDDDTGQPVSQICKLSIRNSKQCARFVEPSYAHKNRQAHERVEMPYRWN